MHHSFLLPQVNGKIMLTRTLRQHLRLRPTCLLHAALIADSTTDPRGLPRRDHSIVMSQIPFKQWGSAHRIVLNTSAKIGSLARTLAILHELKLNVLTQDATAASMEGDLHATFIVEIPSDYRDRAEDLGKEIQKRMVDHNVHSSSLLYNDDLNPTHALKHVHCTPLTYLQRYHRIATSIHNCSEMQNPTDSRCSPVGQFKIEASCLDLDDGCMGTHGKQHSMDDETAARRSWYAFMAGQLASRRDEPANALISLDSDELYLRLWLVPSRPIFRFTTDYKLSVRNVDGGQSILATEHSATPRDRPKSAVILHSDRDAGYRGAAAAFVDKLSGAPLHMNIYRMETHLVRKDGEDGPESEEFCMDIVGDVNMSAVGCRLEDVVKPFRDAQKGWARDWNADDANSKLEILNLNKSHDDVSYYAHAQIPVFMSTNIKPGMRKRYIKMAAALSRVVREHGYYPVSIDVSAGGDLLAEALELLRMCPLLISIHFPDDALQLAKPLTNGARHVPSLWVMFEESFAVSRADKYTIRLRHRDVIQPNHTSGRVECASFTSEKQSIRDAIRSLDLRLTRLRRDGEWYDYIMNLDRGPASSLHRNIFRHRDFETWLGTLRNAIRP